MAHWNKKYLLLNHSAARTYTNESVQIVVKATRREGVRNRTDSELSTEFNIIEDILAKKFTSGKHFCDVTVTTQRSFADSETHKLGFVLLTYFSSPTCFSPNVSGRFVLSFARKNSSTHSSSKSCNFSTSSSSRNSSAKWTPVWKKALTATYFCGETLFAQLCNHMPFLPG